jgi:hypothetical protein
MNGISRFDKVWNWVLEVPCNEVKRHLSSLSAGVLKLAFSIDDFMKAASTSAPI